MLTKLEHITNLVNSYNSTPKIFKDLRKLERQNIACNLADTTTATIHEINNDSIVFTVEKTKCKLTWVMEEVETAKLETL
jgi:hypothetical protein